MSSLIKKEIREHVFSRKGVWIFFAIAILFSGLTYSFVSVKELSLLAQVEVNMTFMKALIGISILVSIILGSTMVSGEREQGTLESLLLTPLSKVKIILSKVIGILVFWLIISAISLPYFYALTYGTNMLPTILAYLYLIGLPLVISFSLLSLAFSTWISSSKNATLLSIILFLVTAIPMFLSTTMKKSGFAHVIDLSSPVSASMLTLKDWLVNKLSFLTIFLDSLPVLGFLVISIICLFYASKKMDFLGGE
ncbi:ABC transporter permease [Mesobacillus stamsii]|uniref:ABC-2 type transport system permease protein n=1 Tax=Mesobacillus stamsii TaxID=225347 RepID=A0ABU0FY54_9BACI|nr:ABC transporter permease subunit [Mesobacillus stamsii]MDQ0414765.1 ABC-2 type transport system permease protein [Mesobacillus stamsii]